MRMNDVRMIASVVSCTGPEPFALSRSRRRDHSVAVMSIGAPGLPRGNVDAI
jgi:hypothetical protein